MEKSGWSVNEVSFGYTLYFFLNMAASILFGAKLKKILSIRNEVLIGALLYGGGIIMMNFMRRIIIELYLYFGVISAFGCMMVLSSSVFFCIGIIS